MKISEAAVASGCHLETIRYYERVGLMPPPTRTGSGYRAYTPGDVERLRFITRGRELGFSLEEIRSLLRLNDDPKLSCGNVDVLARAHLADIHQRIEALTRMASELEGVIAQCAGGERGTCTILGALRHPGNDSTSCTDPVCRP
ncbi:MerR family transcriptional regulator [Lysobacter silvisoli]|jgi:MerR family mercuric resistance operon transcriptional regulator|uniref:MerR family transcriptional regulator n=2 Tax=Lysobacter silvisoli TaxID=2293254 RepID=A0A371K3N6_9GAMM|nr:helix-turn-helix domain-containing protein [Pseudoxanthomonas mexicana]KAF1723462.1 MerR family transcriptional regulator [Pseudoxanthomonas mexicana]RDZ28545.1 MerR family transcriptional regulator [Lysobacter silvisoli]